MNKFNSDRKVSTIELARVLNITPEAVRSLTRRGLLKLESDGTYLKAKSARSYAVFEKLFGLYKHFRVPDKARRKVTGRAAKKP
jgi:Mn-dependent DtxR family transcriptional regulator